MSPGLTLANFNMASDGHSMQSTSSTSSSNTLKSLTNPHIIRGIATLKDDERFWKRHLERYRESIVKLPMLFIVKYLSNKLHTLSKAIYILTYTGSGTTKDLSKEYQQSTTGENTKIPSTFREVKGLPISTINDNSKPCDSQSGDDFPRHITSFSIMLSILVLLLFLIQGNISCFTVLIVLILTVLGVKTVSFTDYYTQTVVTSSFSDCDILDKTYCLTAYVNYFIYNDAEVTICSIKITKNTRSRYFFDQSLNH
jgi:hypothetical protein